MPFTPALSVTASATRAHCSHRLLLLTRPRSRLRLTPS